MTVYRVENANGEGMYRNRVFSDRDCPLNDCYDMYRHPMPSSDDALCKSIGTDMVYWHRYHFGFSSISQLKNWLYTDDVRSKLANAGFVISVYECETEFHGDTQAVFIRDTARKVAALNLETI